MTDETKVDGYKYEHNSFIRSNCNGGTKKKHESSEIKELELRAKEYQRRAMRLFAQGKRIAADELLKKRAKLLKRIKELKKVLEG